MSSSKLEGDKAANPAIARIRKEKKSKSTPSVVPLPSESSVSAPPVSAVSTLSVSSSAASINAAKREGSSYLSSEAPGSLGLHENLGSESFQIIKLLGVGSQGKVYLVQLKDTNELYAMKVFKKEDVVANEKTTDSILTEHRFLATSRHPFITRLFYSFHSAERLFMVMEYCPGGELFTAIKKQPGCRLTEDQVRFYSSEVILVLEYVHSMGYIYRDLKPENILLHLDGHIRMADFGLSKKGEGYGISILTEKRKTLFGKRVKLKTVSNEVVRTDSLVGSVHYLAPEVLVGTGYDAMADWWALGVLLYDMLYGFPPFQGMSTSEVFTKILTCEYSIPSDIPASHTIKDLIKRLLTYDPKKRLGARFGAEDIKRHPFFSGIKWSLLRNRKPPIIPKIASPTDTSNFLPFDDDEKGFEFFSELEEDPKKISTKSQAKFTKFQYSCQDFDETLRVRRATLALDRASIDEAFEQMRQEDASNGESSRSNGKEHSNGGGKGKGKGRKRRKDKSKDKGKGKGKDKETDENTSNSEHEDRDESATEPEDSKSDKESDSEQKKSPSKSNGSKESPADSDADSEASRSSVQAEEFIPKTTDELSEQSGVDDETESAGSSSESSSKITQRTPSTLEIPVLSSPDNSQPNSPERAEPLSPISPINLKVIAKDVDSGPRTPKFGEKTAKKRMERKT